MLVFVLTKFGRSISLAKGLNITRASNSFTFFVILKRAWSENRFKNLSPPFFFSQILSGRQNKLWFNSLEYVLMYSLLGVNTRI